MKRKMFHLPVCARLGMLLLSGCAHAQTADTPASPDLSVFQDTRDVDAYYRQDTQPTKSWSPTLAGGQHPNPLLQQASDAFTRNDLNGALRLALQAAQKDPNSADAWHAAGSYYNMLGKLAESIQAYERLLQLDPMRPHVGIWMAENHLGMGNGPMALKLISEEINRNPNDSWALSWMGTAYLQNNENEKAATYLARALQTDPQAHYWRFNNGVHLYNQGQHMRALMDFRAAMLMVPQDSQAYYWAGLSYESLGKTSYAMQMFQEYLQRDSRSEWAQKARQKIQQLQ